MSVQNDDPRWTEFARRPDIIGVEFAAEPPSASLALHTRSGNYWSPFLRSSRPKAMLANSAYREMSLKKIIIAVVVVLAVAAIVGFTVVRAQSGYTKVITGKLSGKTSSRR